MNNLWVILKAGFINNFGINKILNYTKKNLFATIGLVIGALISIEAFVYMYVQGIGSMLLIFGQLKLLLMIGIVASIGITLFSTIYKSQGILFSAKDVDNLLAMPIKEWVIFTSKALQIIIYNYLMTFIIMIPVLAYYYMNTEQGVGFLITSIVGLIFVPFIPVILSSLIGIIIAYVSSRFKKSSFIGIILSFAALAGIFILSMNAEAMNGITSDGLGMIYTKIGQYIPPARFFTEAVAEGSVVDLVKLILIGTFALILFILIFSKLYLKIHSSLSQSYKGKKLKEIKIKGDGVLTSLIKREARRYFASTIYVVNTSIGILLLLLSSFGVLIGGQDILNNMFAMAVPEGMFALIAIAIFSACIGGSGVTHSSISLEGNRIWVLKSMPLAFKDIARGKMGFNIILVWPFLLLASIVMTFALKLSFVNFLWLLFIPSLYLIFVAGYGLFINLLFPKMEWTSEVVVVKQSLAAFLGMFSTMVGVFLPVYLFMKIAPSNYNIFLAGVALVLIILIVGINLLINTIGERNFKDL